VIPTLLVRHETKGGIASALLNIFQTFESLDSLSTVKKINLVRDILCWIDLDVHSPARAFKCLEGTKTEALFGKDTVGLIEGLSRTKITLFREDRYNLVEIKFNEDDQDFEQHTSSILMNLVLGGFLVTAWLNDVTDIPREELLNRLIEFEKREQKHLSQRNWKEMKASQDRLEILKGLKMIG